MMYVLETLLEAGYNYKCTSQSMGPYWTLRTLRVPHRPAGQTHSASHFITAFFQDLVGQLGVMTSVPSDPKLARQTGANRTQSNMETIKKTQSSLELVSNDTFAHCLVRS